MSFVGDAPAFSLVAALVGLEFQAAGGCQASRLFGVNEDAHSRGRERKGDFGPGNRLMGRSGSSGNSLKSAVSGVDHFVA